MRSILPLVILLTTVGGPCHASESIARTPFEPIAETLDSIRQPNEADQDHNEALTCFSTARSLQKRNQPAAAIRYYQKALRRDPQAWRAAVAIVKLATLLGRDDEKNRYLIKLAQIGPDRLKPAQIVDLVESLRLEGTDRDKTIELLEAVYEGRQGGRPSPADLILWWHLAELYAESDRDADAANLAERILEALDQPDSLGMSQKVVDSFLKGPVDPYTVLGDYFLKGDRPKLFEKIIKRLQEQKKDPGRIALAQARLAMENGQADTALDLLETSFTYRPLEDSSRAYELLKKTLRALGREKNLVDRLERLHQKWPDAAALGYYLANEYLNSKRTEEAEQVYTKLLKTAPIPKAFLALARIARQNKRPNDWTRLLALSLSQRGTLEPLAEEIDRLADDPDWTGRIFDKIDRFGRLASGSSKRGDSTLPALAMLALELSRYDDYRSITKILATEQPEWISPLELIHGGLLLEQDRAKEAAEAFAEAIKYSDNRQQKSTCAYFLAIAYLRSRQADRAEKAINAALAVAPESPRLLLHQAWIDWQMGKTDQAIRRTVDFLDRHDDRATGDITHRKSTPPLPPGQKGSLRQLVREAHLMLAHLELSRGDLDRASDLLETVLDEYPDDLATMNDLGFLWIDAGRHPQRAMAMIQKAARSDPKNCAYLDSLGWALFRHNRPLEAAATLEKAVALSKKPVGEILDHLADVYEALGQHKKAKKARQSADRAYRESGTKRPNGP
jgi:tetratricopeptide (TPR) repeat protein